MSTDIASRRRRSFGAWFADTGWRHVVAIVVSAFDPVRVPCGFSDDETTNTIGKSENATMTTPTTWRHPVAANQRAKLNGRRGGMRRAPSPAPLPGPPRAACARVEASVSSWISPATRPVGVPGTGCCADIS